jgi:hypothetical protein
MLSSETRSLDELVFPIETLERVGDISGKVWDASLAQARDSQVYANGLLRYFHDFIDAFVISLSYFQDVESRRILEYPLAQTIQDYTELLLLNQQLALRALKSSISTVGQYYIPRYHEITDSWLDTVLSRDGRNLAELFSERERLMEKVVYEYPEAIRNIRSEYGFHFDQAGYRKAGETDRFLLYQVLPSHGDVPVREDAKPVVVIPPFVLGTNILAFLPGENKSFVHAFANKGIPTYIRIAKNIWTTPAFQVMTGEDDVRDIGYFAEIVKNSHGKQVTLCGYCQGGFTSLCGLLSGELDSLVDTLITCVSPMDGTRSPGLANFLHNLPPRFNDLAYGTKTLPNGNKVGDGKLMGWVYKLRAIDDEFPLISFYRDMVMLSTNGRPREKFNKTALAINYWLSYERTYLPLEITKMSFRSYNIPITSDGTLPVRLFGRKLNLHRMQEKGYRWLICYGERDDLVEKETALAPQDFIDVEVTGFPKGHLAIATSWSNPKSEYSLDKRFGEKNVRGPVLFQLEIDQS